MKVFITWSGDTSKAIAKALHEFIPTVVQTVDAFMSASDIEKGSKWQSDISRELDASTVGIICLTGQNLTAPWVLFEAGALSKKIVESGARVCTYLHKIVPADIQPPLSMFQHTVAEKEDTRRLIHDIKAFSKATLSGDALNKLFDLMWPALEDQLANAPVATKDSRREPREMIEEILGLTREVANNQQQLIKLSAANRLWRTAEKKHLADLAYTWLLNHGRAADAIYTDRTAKWLDAADAERTAKDFMNEYLRRGLELGSDKSPSERPETPESDGPDDSS